MPKLTTYADVRREIIDAIEAGGNATAEQYDIDEIAADCYDFSAQDGCYLDHGDADDFWASVERHAL